MVIEYERHLKRYARKNRANLTIGEAMLWKRLQGRQLEGIRFLRQRPIGPYIVDFFAPELNLVIEIDGRTHHGREKEDLEREEEIKKFGVTFVRFTEHEVRRNVNGMAEWIAKVARELGWKKPLLSRKRQG